MIKGLVGALLVAFAVVGCGDHGAATASGTNTSATAPMPKPLPVAAPIKDHNYAAKDGLEYGYPSALSEDARKGGQVASQVLMFRYAGERDGKHQVHTTDGATVTALECSNPCELIKAMTFIDKDYLRDTIKIERLVNQEGSVAHAVLQDALGGKLRQYGMERGGKKYQVWVDEKRGFREFAVQSAAAAGT